MQRAANEKSKAMQTRREHGRAAGRVDHRTMKIETFKHALRRIDAVHEYLTLNTRVYPMLFTASVFLALGAIMKKFL
jgi:hypothetical protein